MEIRALLRLVWEHTAVTTADLLEALLKKKKTHTKSTGVGREAVPMNEEQKQYKAKTRVGIFSFLPARVLKSLKSLLLNPNVQGLAERRRAPRENPQRLICLRGRTILLNLTSLFSTKSFFA